MATISVDWGSYTTDGTINNVTVSNAGSQTGDATSMDGLYCVQVAVQCTYGGTATQGLKIFVLADYDGTNYQLTTDNVYSIAMVYATSAAKTCVFTIYASDFSRFKIKLTNDAGADITATYVRYKTATITSV